MEYQFLDLSDFLIRNYYVNTSLQGNMIVGHLDDFDSGIFNVLESHATGVFDREKELFRLLLFSFCSL